MRTQVNLNLNHISIPEMIENGRHYVTNIGANPAVFSTPNPALTGVTTVLNNVETAYNNALSGGPAFTAILREKKAAAIHLLTQLGHYVEAVSNGSEAIILQAGMIVKGKAAEGLLYFL